MCTQTHTTHIRPQRGSREGLSKGIASAGPISPKTHLTRGACLETRSAARPPFPLFLGVGCPGTGGASGPEESSSGRKTGWSAARGSSLWRPQQSQGVRGGPPVMFRLHVSRCRG